MQLLTDDPDVTFLCYTSSYDIAKKLVRVRRKRKKKGLPMKTDNKIDISIEHAQYVKEIVLGLSLGNGEFLLNAMFVTEEAKKIP